jgi:hypothetical protein
MSQLFYQLGIDEKFQDVIFNDDPEEKLSWDETYYALLQEHFGKRFDDAFKGFDITPNPDNKGLRKNTDICVISASSIIILSKNAVHSIGCIIESSGQFLPVNFPWKNYCAFHVTRVISNAVIWEKSEYRQADYGKILYHPVLKKEVVSDENLFMLEEDVSTIFVSQKLKDTCESNQLKGLDFSLKRPVQTQ